MKHVLVFIVLCFCIQAHYCLPKYKSKAHNKAIKNSETWSSEVSEKVQITRKLDAATRKILEKAKSVQKPKSYTQILKRARKFDKKPQKVIEIGDRKKVELTSGRGFMTFTDKLWRYQMLIVIDPEFTQQQRDDIQAAVYTLKTAMKCFDFQVLISSAAPNITDYLNIRPKDEKMKGSCSSKLGRVGGRQVTIISNKCKNYYGVVMHEVMHVLGFYHEQVRPDRDNYVNIKWDRLKDNGTAHQYKIREQKVLVKEYDFESIMHYPFNKYMDSKVLVPQNVTVGQRSHLSKWDVARLRKAYPCGLLSKK